MYRILELMWKNYLYCYCPRWNTFERSSQFVLSFFLWSRSWSWWEWRERPVRTDTDGTPAGEFWLRPRLWCRQGISGPPRWWSGMEPHTRYEHIYPGTIIRTWYMVPGTWYILPGIWYIVVCYIPRTSVFHGLEHIYTVSVWYLSWYVRTLISPFYFCLEVYDLF